MKELIVSLRLIFVMTVLTGAGYPLIVTGIGGLLFPEKSQGSLIRHDGEVVGSSLVGQKFTSEKYFWGRPSAVDYNPMPSGGSNLAPTSKNLVAEVAKRQSRFPEGGAIPGDLLSTSASGIDPHISVAAAYFQIDRIVRARGWDQGKKAVIKNLILEHTEMRQWGVLGEVRVNVLELNLALDRSG